MEKTKRASTSRESDKYIVRFPDGMRDRIAEAAKASGRSMNAEIVSRLERSFAADEAGLPTDALDMLSLQTLLLLTVAGDIDASKLPEGKREMYEGLMRNAQKIIRKVELSEEGSPFMHQAKKPGE